MTTETWIERNHRYCEHCGERMQRVTTRLVSKFSRISGEEVKGLASHWWQCPNWDTTTDGVQHDHEAWSDAV